jgi:hypothetical protein
LQNVRAVENAPVEDGVVKMNASNSAEADALFRSKVNNVRILDEIADIGGRGRVGEDSLESANELVIIKIWELERNEDELFGFRDGYFRFEKLDDFVVVDVQRMTVVVVRQDARARTFLLVFRHFHDNTSSLATYTVRVLVGSIVDILDHAAADVSISCRDRISIGSRIAGGIAV